METLPIWLFLFWTLGAPLLWVLVDRLRTHGSLHRVSDRPLPLRAKASRQSAGDRR